VGLSERFTLRFGPADRMKMSSARLCDKSGYLRSVGRLFQTRGPATLKALSPKLVRVRLTRGVMQVLAERSLILGQVFVTRRLSLLVV